MNRKDVRNAGEQEKCKEEMKALTGKTEISTEDGKIRGVKTLLLNCYSFN